ncbi:MAG: hypothetical protein K2X82_28365, partial [Gemmataceae bacterium]|nr:hypothetical protein [Gemmataceae bacterium]
MTPRHPVRLRAERLDDRVTPATFTVTTTADDGPGSLRAAVAAAEAAPDHDTIVFAAQLADEDLGTVVLANYASYPLLVPGVGDRSVGPAAFRVSTPVTIDGGGVIGLFQSRAPSNRLVTVAPSGSLTLRNLTVRGWGSSGQRGAGGGAGLGGAVYNQGTFRADNVVFDGNGAGGGDGGYDFGGGGLDGAGAAPAGGGPNGGGSP